MKQILLLFLAVIATSKSSFSLVFDCVRTTTFCGVAVDLYGLSFLLLCNLLNWFNVHAWIYGMIYFSWRIFFLRWGEWFIILLLHMILYVSVATVSVFKYVYLMCWCDSTTYFWKKTLNSLHINSSKWFSFWAKTTSGMLLV